MGRAPFIGTLLLGRAIKLKIKIKLLITNKKNERASRREVGKMDMVIIMRVPTRKRVSCRRATGVRVI